MPQKLYPSNAERQRAFRDRQRLVRAAGETPPIATSKQRPRLSRPRRILAMAAEARKLADEYQNWHDSLPENLAGGQTASRIEEVITELEEIADMLHAMEPPAVGR